jgi:hypothetical protein
MKTKLLILIVLLFNFESHSQCTNIPASTTSGNLTYAFFGGSFQSFGCAPIDPTYWIAGSGPSVTVTFTTPQNYPKFRVWGMNTDDIASVMVNGVSYPLNATSAGYEPKVVCGISPGPDGVAFLNGNIIGANTPQAGNFSYNDVQLKTTGVNSFKITGVAGAGWGFASIVILCPLENNEFDWNSNVAIYSSLNKVYIDVSEELIGASVVIYDLLGKEIKKFKLTELNTIQNVDKGIYLIKMENESAVFTKKILVN